MAGRPRFRSPIDKNYKVNGQKTRYITIGVIDYRPAKNRSRGDRGIGPPLSGLGDNPPTFCCNIGKKYQNLLRIA